MRSLIPILDLHGPILDLHGPRGIVRPRSSSCDCAPPSITQKADRRDTLRRGKGIRGNLRKDWLRGQKPKRVPSAEALMSLEAERTRHCRQRGAGRSNGPMLQTAQAKVTVYKLSLPFCDGARVCIEPSICTGVSACVHTYNYRGMLARSYDLCQH